MSPVTIQVMPVTTALAQARRRVGGRQRYYWRLVATDGQVLARSEVYENRHNAERAAFRFSRDSGFPVTGAVGTPGAKA